MMLETQLIICVVHYFNLTDFDRPLVQLEQNSFTLPIATKRVCVCVCAFDPQILLTRTSEIISLYHADHSTTR